MFTIRGEGGYAHRFDKDLLSAVEPVADIASVLLVFGKRLISRGGGMLDFWAAIAISPFLALWFGFFIEREFKKGTIYNLIGYASKKGLTAKQAERAVSKHFAKWDWLLLSLSIHLGLLALTFFIHDGSAVLVVILASLGLGLLLWCMKTLYHHNLAAYRELD